MLDRQNNAEIADMAAQAVAAADAAAGVAAPADRGDAVVIIRNEGDNLRIESEDPDQVSIGSINVPSGTNISIETKGGFEANAVNVGTQVPGHRAGTQDYAWIAETPGIVLIAVLFIVFGVIGLLGWRALSMRGRK